MSWRKGSNASVETSGGSNGSRGGGVSTKDSYPYALTLRIRVVQIVCGIAAVVMGCVAAIEERNNFNLSLGLPAGAVTVLAAGWSVHKSLHKNAGGRRVGLWVTRILWAIAGALDIVLLILAIRTAFKRHQDGESCISNTSLSLAVVQGLLAGGILVAAGFAAKLRWIYGPPPNGPPPRQDRCPRSTSHTAVSMVPLASTYGCHSVVNEISVNKDSENEVMEIILSDNKSLITDKDELQISRSPKSTKSDNTKHITHAEKNKTLERVKSDEKFDSNQDMMDHADEEHMNLTENHVM